ncbi:MAG: homoserine dehydrogenase [Candidatus Omnitrophica bacterium]|nr:homoserine dehydrogenase [Candidatus Omnitrophota bacterium]
MGEIAEMLTRKIGLIGIGTVGKAFLKEFRRNKPFVKKTLNLDLEVVKVCDIDPHLKNFSQELGFPFTTDPQEIINDPQIDILIELIGGINPAKKFIISSLKKGKDIITANKALLSSEGREIFQLAYKLKRAIRFEASVASAIPLIKSISEVLKFARIKSIYAILNGTTNFILTEMQKHKVSLFEALEKAKKKGIAERNSSLDIKGIDSLHKISILCFLCFGKFPNLEEVLTEGIEKISLQDIHYAEELGFRIKLLAIAKKIKKEIEVRVHPALIPQNHPLAETNGVYNSIFINTEVGRDFFFSGLGAGGKPTALAVFSDLLSLVREGSNFFIPERGSKVNFRKRGQLYSRYYLKFLAKDKPGVLAKISKILADLGISIASVTQKETATLKSKFVPIIMLTHKTKEKDLNKAKEKIDRLPIIKPPTQLIRIEEL